MYMYTAHTIPAWTGKTYMIEERVAARAKEYPG